MEETRIDLTALDPRAHPDRWDEMVRNVSRRAAPELERRRASGAGMLWLAHAARPILAAAAVLALLSGALFGLTHRPTESAGASSIAEALGFPVPVAEWLADGRTPDDTDLLLALEGGVR